MAILVTGGAGFIGSNFLLDWLAAGGEDVVNLDALTYAGYPGNVAAIAADPRYRFIAGSIADEALVEDILARHRVRAIVNFAAETHVDRSISGPAAFVQTNIVGTSVLLDAARRYFEQLAAEEGERFRFLHVSTDEVYGSLAPADLAFTEEHPYRPNSPYAASKAASDHLVRAYRATYGLPTLITNCSNNYGPRQFPEKLIPLVLHNALAGKPLPVYGDGQQVRDWLYVGDHCAAIRAVLAAGTPGETYNIGGQNEATNLAVVRAICAELDRRRPRPDGRSYAEQITHVTDRPGHDRRYAIDSSKIRLELGWEPREDFESGLSRTIAWYLDNADWVAEVTSGDYRDWISRHYS